MTSAIAESVSFLRQNDVKTILSRIRERNVPGLIQFAIYGICGGLATVVFLATVVIFSKKIIPAYEGMTVNGVLIDDTLRARNLLINNCIAFLIANVVAYVTNVMFVFKQGRHHPVFEFLYFTLVSGVSFGISQIAGPWLVKQYGVPTNVAILTNMIASMMLNFAGRKFFVFKD
jgi:putative flippase GtrA